MRQPQPSVAFLPVNGGKMHENLPEDRHSFSITAPQDAQPNKAPAPTRVRSTKKTGTFRYEYQTSFYGFGNTETELFA